MNRIAIAFAALVSLLLPSTSFAEPEWALSAGIATSAAFGGGTPLLVGAVAGVSSSTALVGGLSASPLQPRLALMIERRLSHRVWLLGRVDGTLSDTSTSNGADPSRVEFLSGSASRSRSLGLQLGPRFVFSEGGPVELSSFVVAAWGRSLTDIDATTTIRSPGSDTAQERVDHVFAASTQAGASVGIAAERTLMDALSLRISAAVFNVAWTHSRVTGPSQDNTTNGLSAGLVFAPALDLRLAF